MTRSKSTINKFTYLAEIDNIELDKQIGELKRIDKKNCIEIVTRLVDELKKLKYPTDGKIRKYNILKQRLNTDSKRHTTEISLHIAAEAARLKHQRSQSMASQTKREKSEVSQIVTEKKISKQSSVKPKSEPKSIDKKSQKGEFSDWKKSESSDKSVLDSMASDTDPVDYFTRKKIDQNRSQMTVKTDALSRGGPEQSHAENQEAQDLNELIETSSGRKIAKGSKKPRESNTEIIEKL